jgi:hypothetical protein
MIATSRTCRSRPAISRWYEFSRLQGQMLASAYEALVPVVARRPKSLQHQRDDREVSTNARRSSQRSAAGA